MFHRYQHGRVRADGMAYCGREISFRVSWVCGLGRIIPISAFPPDGTHLASLHLSPPKATKSCRSEALQRTTVALAIDKGDWSAAPFIVTVRTQSGCEIVNHGACTGSRKSWSTSQSLRDGGEIDGGWRASRRRFGPPGSVNATTSMRGSCGDRGLGVKEDVGSSGVLERGRGNVHRGVEAKFGIG